MIPPSFRYFPIDLGDIWDFERGLLLHNGGNEHILEASLEEIRNTTVEKGRPSVTYDGSQYSEDAIRYYRAKVDRYLNTKNIYDQVALDYFISRDDLYQYTQDIVFEKNDTNFDYWFTFKLRQYDWGLKYLKEFLDYHLEYTFEANASAYIAFLELSLLQYEIDIIPNKVFLQTKKYINSLTLQEFRSQTEQKSKSTNTNKRPRSLGNFHAFKLIALHSNPRYFTSYNHQLKEVFQDLMDYGFIKEKSSFSSFEKTFSNQKINKDKRLHWVGGYIYLKLFIRFLLDNQIIEPMGNDHWVVMTQCFLDHDGKELDIIKVSKANGGTKNKVEKLESIIDRL